MDIIITNKNPNVIGKVLMIDNNLDVQITSDLQLDEEIAENITITCKNEDYLLIQNLLTDIIDTIPKEPNELEKIRSDIDYLAMCTGVNL